MDNNLSKECLLLRGDEIRKQRERQGLSQTKLALMINSGQSYINRVESGKVNLGIENLVRIAEALDVEVKDLICF